jgi:hypothetical protein
MTIVSSDTSSFKITLSIMNDIHIRSALLRKLNILYKGRSDTLILQELGLFHGIVRADVVVVNSHLHGYELKSDSDNLDRLPHQSRVYNQVFDRITLIVGYQHAYEALTIIPEWWGVKLVEMGPRGGMYFTSARSPKNNPKPDPLAIAMLLWKSEALSLLEDIRVYEKMKSKPRSEIYSEIAKSVDITLIRSKVRQQLMARVNWRSGDTQMLYGD